MAQAQKPALTITGKIINEKTNEPVAGASIILKISQASSVSGNDGKFMIRLAAPQDTLVVRHLGYKTKEVGINDQAISTIIIPMEKLSAQLKEIVVSTGYQDIPKERATGSFDFIDNELLNRNTSPHILDRIENLTPGILFNHGDAAATDPLLIRGRSTIYANAAPLIVVNNFPYDGDINNINPNDVESITILKDAAAASIWGARAGNGVIVITTKKGKTVRPQLTFNTSVTIGKKPDLFNIHTISSGDFIDVEKYLFSQGYYNNTVTNPFHSPRTPVVELLFAKANGSIPAAQADAQIEALKQYDVRNDIEKFFYRNSVDQQYSVNVSGKTNTTGYYLSAGWDHSLSNLVKEQADRINLRTQNTFNVSRSLQIDATANYVQNINAKGNNPGYLLNSGGGKSIYPYAQLKDAYGNPLSIVSDYQTGFKQSAMQAGLLNWLYYPVTDINNESNSLVNRDVVIDAAIRYKISGTLSAELKYQFENELITGNDFHNDSSYFVRNMINNFTQIDPNTGILSYPVPMGGILDMNNTTIISHQGRAQLNYNQTWGDEHQVTAIGGWEIKDLTTTGNSYRLYGYEPDISNASPYMNFSDYYSLYPIPFITQQIPSGINITQTTDRFLSYYANASYTYDHRYIISGSARDDMANLFGVRTNQKATPLWSAGVSWLLNREKFYTISWLPVLRLKVTYGYNGNISRLASAYTTAYYSTAVTTPANMATIKTPPNEHLRWEQTRVVNFGVNFELKNSTLSGSLEYYLKSGKNLMGEAPVDPTLGLYNAAFNQSFFYGNVAGMTGKGADIQLTSHNLDGNIKWHTTFVFSYATSKVTQWLMPGNGTGNSYLEIGSYAINPVKGRPVYSVYSYPWGGLDHATGDPLSLLAGSPTNNYQAVFQLPIDSMVYNGPAQPVYYGAIRNSFIWKNFTFSFNISYKLGYYFRRYSINYYSLFSNWAGNSDYAKRWQKPGDEKTTSVPSMIYPANGLRDDFYKYSAALIEKADNVRLEDISLSYEINRSQKNRIPFGYMRLYLYASNLGMLWTADKERIDPYYNNIPKAGKNITLGVNVSF